MVRPILLLTVLFVAAFALPAALASGAGGASSMANSCQANSNFRCCGDIQLVFRNPDLNPGSPDEVIDAEGQFFAQFQAIGEKAGDIAFFGFSFSPIGHSLSESQVCDREPWLPSGPYIINYRADTDASDGYFINLQTTLVPDGSYMAAVHAYDHNDREIARAWVDAVVNNCDATGPVPPARCDGNYPTAEHIRHDKTMPWPIMLPGDGELDPSKIGAPSDATLTLEFAEPLSALKVYLNGILIHEKGAMENMTEYDGRRWDNDLLPGYGPAGVGGLVAPECSQQPPQSCAFLAKAYAWSGRELTGDDVVRVEATDMAGNLAKKEIHIGSGQGGAITSDLPVLQLTADRLSRTINQSDVAIFRVEMTNTGGSTAHPFTSFDPIFNKETGRAAPGAWDIAWLPHKAVEPGAKDFQELTVRPGLGAVPGIYQVNGTISWNEGIVQKDRTWQFTVNFGGVAPGSGGPGGPSDVDDAKNKGSPLPLVVPALALGLVAWRRRR